MYFSSDFIHLHFFISCSSLGFLNSAFFWIVYHRSWLLWGWLLKNVCAPWVVSCYLKACIAVFTFEEEATYPSHYWQFWWNTFCQSSKDFWSFHKPLIWIHLLYSSCSLFGDNYQQWMPSLNTENPGQVKTVLRLLSLWQWLMLTFVCLLPVTQTLVCFWHMPTSHPKIFMTQITMMIWSFTKARHPRMRSFRSITMNKASGSDEIPVELFQILKDDAVKVLHSICQQIQKTQQWPQDWKRSVFILVPKKGNAKIMFKLLNDCIHLTLAK